MKKPVPFLVLGLLMGLIPVAASAGETVEFPQGVRLEIRSADGRVDIHHTRLVTLFVPEGEAPTPFLPAGPFSATWTGHINVDLRDRFRFGFQGNGTFQFFIDGRVRLEADSRDPESLVGRARQHRLRQRRQCQWHTQRPHLDNRPQRLSPEL